MISREGVIHISGLVLKLKQNMVFQLVNFSSGPKQDLNAN